MLPTRTLGYTLWTEHLARPGFDSVGQVMGLRHHSSVLRPPCTCFAEVLVYPEYRQSSPSSEQVLRNMAEEIETGRTIVIVGQG